MLLSRRYDFVFVQILNTFRLDLGHDDLVHEDLVHVDLGHEDMYGL